MADLSWIERFGLQESDLPSCANTCAGSALVVASGWSLWEDLELAGRIDERAVIAVKDAGLYLPRQVDHWYSSHADQMLLLRKMRGCRRRLGNLDTRRPVTHGLGDAGDNVQHRWPWPGHSSSGLMAIYTALGLGFGDILVVGMPQDDLGHFYDPPAGHPLARHPTNFDKAKNEKLWGLAEETIFKGRVRVMSGNGKRWIEAARR